MPISSICAHSLNQANLAGLVPNDLSSVGIKINQKSGFLGTKHLV
jgi:hypothetical protein